MIHDYKCAICGTIREIDNTGPEKDFICCGETMVRVWTANPIHFKGTGFYTTDYGKNAK